MKLKKKKLKTPYNSATQMIRIRQQSYALIFLKNLFAEQKKTGKKMKDLT